MPWLLASQSRRFKRSKARQAHDLLRRGMRRPVEFGGRGRRGWERCFEIRSYSVRSHECRLPAAFVLYCRL